MANRKPADPMEPRRGVDHPPPAEHVKTFEEVADAIVAIGNAAKSLTRSRLNRKALVILLHHSCKMPMKDIERVLDGLANLEATYLKKPGA